MLCVFKNTASTKSTIPPTTHRYTPKRSTTPTLHAILPPLACIQRTSVTAGLLVALFQSPHFDDKQNTHAHTGRAQLEEHCKSYTQPKQPDHNPNPIPCQPYNSVHVQLLQTCAAIATATEAATQYTTAYTPHKIKLNTVQSLESTIPTFQVTVQFLHSNAGFTSKHCSIISTHCSLASHSRQNFPIRTHPDTHTQSHKHASSPAQIATQPRCNQATACSGSGIASNEPGQHQASMYATS